MPIKKHLSTCLLIGLGVIVPTTYGYAKPHTTTKKPALTQVKETKTKKTVVALTSKPHKTSKTQKHQTSSSKSKPVVAILHTKSHKDLLHSKHKHSASLLTKLHARQHVRLKHHHHYLAKHTSQHIEQDTSSDEILTNLAAEFNDSALNQPILPAKIPHTPSHNPFVNVDSQPIANKRIHALIPAKKTTDDSNPADNSNYPYSSAYGIIESTLEDAGREAGLSDQLIDQLTSVFAWDIDFATNLHQGDEFTVVYQTGMDGNEQIIAAEFVNEGKVLTAVRYEDYEGNVNYYTPEGKAMRKAFLSTPVEYARISSHFSTNRRHPILNRIRAHKGVDYAARTGTPVKAAGDGSITFMGRKGGYGQVIILKHGEHYETLYAHLSGFKRGLLDGDNVHQGDIIGYVGQTGLATGPHLHYEFRVDGVHKNPERQTSRHLLTLNDNELVDFKTTAKPVLAQLYSVKARTLLAKNQQHNE